MRTQQYEATTETRHAPPPEIAGRSWQVSGSVAKCAVPPHARPPHEAQAVTPDPTKHGWRIAWLFLDVLAGIALGIGAYVHWMVMRLGPVMCCTVLALPFWVCR